MQGRETDAESRSVVLQWIGDISLNGLYCDPQHHPALVENMVAVSRALGECDLRIANWESPLEGDGSVNILKKPRLSTTREAAECLLPLGLDAVLLANNHVYDCLEQGFQNTVRFFADNNIRWLGAGRSAEEASKPLVLTRRGLRLGLLNFVGPETHPNLPEDAGVHLNMLRTDRLLADVESLSETVDVVLVALHWGEVEQIGYPTVEQRRIARLIVEAGAKVVACHHAHCLQGHEAWANGHILYGLGNFLFNGYYKGVQGRPWPKACRHVGVATTVVSKQKVLRASMSFFRQRDLLLARDDRPSRFRRQARLNRSLRLSDARLARLFSRTYFFQWAVAAPLRFLWQSGGPVSAVRRLRREHLTHFLKAVARHPGRSID
jgi:hypothetical protein